jgi:hypothetical protein
VTGQASRNLVIVHTPGHQALSDWVTVKAKIDVQAPDIEVRIADNSIPNSATRRWQTRRPSLVFSPSPLIQFTPAGGRIYAGRRLNKLEQFAALRAAGVPTPDSALFRPDVALSPRRWGEFVVLKPSGQQSSYGRFVRLVPTPSAGTRYRELGLDQGVEMMVQQFIDPTDNEGRAFEFRVMTMFGRPMYSLKAMEKSPRSTPAEIAGGDGELALNRKGLEREIKLEIEDDIIDLARTTAAAVPEVPCLGIDIIREHATGRLFVLETNGASVWHLSSRSTPNYPQEVRDGLYGQFNALDSAAELLIERTRAEAV